MLYFAYGSNMPTEQIRCSDAEAEFRGVAELPDHRLGFTRFARSRKCGVADIVPSAGDSVWGVLWEVSKQGFNKLDVREGVKCDSYKRQSVVVLCDGVDVVCVTYVVVDKNEFIPPNLEYLGILIAGAIEHDLPTDYVAELKKTPVAS